MTFPTTRLRRLRGSPILRSMVRETSLHVSDFIMPLFVVPGSKVKKPISSMPGNFNLSVDMAVEESKKLFDLGITSTLLFGIPEYKDDSGSAAWDDNGIVQQAVRAIKEQVPGMFVVTDLCFCEYTAHGHCGVMHEGKLLNDPTLEIIVKQTLSHARCGADMIAPSGMLDGAVAAMRKALDSESFDSLPIMGYSAKFASGFYGPFREAAQSAPQYGDRKTYQMDPSNRAEALREIELDIEEGADIIMVKPAMAFLDVIYAAKQRFGLPLAAYNVSGEFAMVKAAAEKGWIDGERIMIEVLYGIRRAGADIIISYFAPEFAKLAKGGFVAY
ncbi:MAG: porphobilinogen synthase [Proteobacteria bacterium]|nr:MAG: porphobilinogen synthase [Pseudomonadota bacterium]